MDGNELTAKPGNNGISYRAVVSESYNSEAMLFGFSKGHPVTIQLDLEVLNSVAGDAFQPIVTHNSSVLSTPFRRLPPSIQTHV